MSRFMSGICWLIYEWLISQVGTPHAGVFDQIVAGLALDEIDDLRPAVDAIRRFMRDPKNPAPRPSAVPLLLSDGPRWVARAGA